MKNKGGVAKINTLYSKKLYIYMVYMHEMMSVEVCHTPFDMRVVVLHTPCVCTGTAKEHEYHLYRI